MLDQVEKLFGTRDLYKLLSLTSDEANDSKKLRNAYLSKALNFHPDKAPDDKDATQKFQILNHIYEMFKDGDSKKAYDHTGEWPTEKFDIDVTGFTARIDMEAVEKFKKEYRGSEAERNDIKKCYEENEGSFIEIFDNVFFINVIDDLERVTKIVEDAIAAGEMERIVLPKSYDAKWKRYIVKRKKEAEEAEEMLAELAAQIGSGGRKKKEKASGNDDNSLQALILKRAEARDTSFLDKLEAKYCKPETKKRKTSKK